MEFRFDVEDLLREEITRVDNNLILPSWKSATRNSFSQDRPTADRSTATGHTRVEYQQLYQIINAIGEASSFAQGLNNVITTAEKMQNSDHFLYLMKEDDDSIGKSLVVGMLKIGRKKLFLLDHNQRTKECAPLCVLDFYIHESRQRRGYGRRLFEYMLRDQNVIPGHMAVDKPSDKFLGFLYKHYGLKKQVPQINNFVVFDSFFSDRPIATEESDMTYVSRSPRASSPERNSRNHSPTSSRRSSSSFSHSAGRPSNPARQANSMCDILHGRQDRHTPSVRLSPRFQPTLDWMRGANSGGDSPYSRTPTSYSASRTPSNTGSPQRTPWGNSPPRSHPHTPPTTSQPMSRKDSTDYVDGQRSMEGSIAPTPATSPDRGSPNKTRMVESEDVINQQPHVDEDDGLVENIEKVSLTDGLEKTPGKTSHWSDSVTRSTVDLAESMASPGGSTMTGVLRDEDSVHGHLKFHHHALW